MNKEPHTTIEESVPEGVGPIRSAEQEEALQLAEYFSDCCPKCGFGKGKNDVAVKRKWIPFSKTFELIVYSCYCGYKWRRRPLDAS